MKRQNKVIATIIVAVIIIAGWLVMGGYFQAGTEDGRERAPSPEAATAEGEIPTVAARPGSISIRVEGPAVVEPLRQLSVRSSISGTVTAAVGVGTLLTAGDTLIQFEGRTFQTALRQAQLNLEEARVNLQRANLAVQRAQRDLDDRESLFASGSITRTERDAAREALSTAELERRSAEIRVDQGVLAVETAEENVAATTIEAPYTGVVLESNVGIGDVVSSGSVLMVFADVSRLRVRAEVDEFDVGTLQPGMAVLITADALGEQEVSSTVETVSPSAEVVNNISIFTVSAVIRADQSPLRPGMSADLTVLVSDDTGLIVPSSALSTVRGRSYIDVFENGEIVTKRVTAGTDDGRNTVVLEGLDEGALVVLPETAAFTLGTTGGTSNTGSSIIPVTIPGSGGAR